MEQTASNRITSSPFSRRSGFEWEFVRIFPERIIFKWNWSLVFNRYRMSNISILRNSYNFSEVSEKIRRFWLIFETQLTHSIHNSQLKIITMKQFIVWWSCLISKTMMILINKFNQFFTLIRFVIKTNPWYSCVINLLVC